VGTMAIKNDYIKIQ